MLFNSIQFFFFFFIVFSLYLVLKHRWQNYLLIVTSCLFYATWSWKFLALMIISISTDYVCASNIEASHNVRTRKIFLWISISVNLAILAFFKYFDFFVANAITILECCHISSPWALNLPKIILPLGISFYTFEAISYVTDVYYRKVKAASSYWDYLLFVIYFPHLIAGPIMRAKNFLPQITSPRLLTWNQFYEGCFLFFWGLFEKVFVADNLAKLVNPLFATQGPYEGGAVLVALYAFTFQIFCDFDGYSNMARGLGKCMGFEITINFKLPYFSKNPREFWQRWHISLSTWLRDYLYIPLGGNRLGVSRMYLALLMTMLLGGLWHGASWTFVCWGLYQAILLIGHRMSVKPTQEVSRKTENSWMIFFKILIFFHLIVLGWLLFRAQSFSQIVHMLQALFFNFKWGGQDVALWLKLAGFVTPLLLVQIWQLKSNDLMVLYKQNYVVRMGIYALMVYLMIGWGIMNAEEFIYFQF